MTTDREIDSIAVLVHDVVLAGGDLQAVIEVLVHLGPLPLDRLGAVAKLALRVEAWGGGVRAAVR